MSHKFESRKQEGDIDISLVSGDLYALITVHNPRGYNERNQRVPQEIEFMSLQQLETFLKVAQSLYEQAKSL